jgi:predicted deacylase
VGYVEHARGDSRGRALAHSLGLRFAEPIDWPDGLLPKVATAHGIQAAEVELGGLGRQDARNLEAGLRAARGAAGLLGLLDGSPPAAPTAVRRHTLRAGVRGRVRHLIELGDAVDVGQPVTEIRALDSTVVETLASPVAGWSAMHVTYGFVEAGADVAIVFEAASDPE